MEYTIVGTIAQRARLDFAPGEAVWLSKGALMAYSPGVEWRPRVPGGLGGALRRSLAGEGISLTYAETAQEGQFALIASNAPGHITEWDLADGPVLATRGSFLAAWGPEVDITVVIARRAGAAFFGGAGLFLQRISGEGKVLLHGSGDFDRRQLAQNETLLVSTGNLAAFADSVDYDIQTVGSVGRAFFGGEGIFMTRLQGPGTVLLQSLKRGTGSSE
ncbi:TIGR00266 family protein [Candidatus Chloroploca sp. M-50]|uniref:TIGR00266 family protein n=1 Tax=Candidatus Chloroploca mongolica TaxID=2528176 RepID=A0ABS4DBP4_9CHLR|nr:TIGR00266 family protein [Candidatus Chloroploca mongolica]MBP1466872.1 TIGR00266 family protein [Candidatus Chloroploca mongolica]